MTANESLAPGVYFTAQNFNNATDDTIVELGDAIIIANDPTIYPLQSRFTDFDMTLQNGTVLGVQSRELTWSEMKSNYDGDGVRVETGGSQVISGFHIENVEDGFSPRGDSTSWTLEDSWFRYIRDDAIENDEIKSGTIENCLIEGTYTFLSMRKGANDQNEYPAANVTITDSLVWIQPMPDDDESANYWSVRWDGVRLTTGALFKMDSERENDTITMTDCVLRVDQNHHGTTNAMAFPPGTYTNVTLVWLGAGDYPADLPEGVTQSTDVNVWHAARHAWIINNGWRYTGWASTLDKLGVVAWSMS